MKCVRNLLFGVGTFAALAVGAGAAVVDVQPLSAAEMRLCGAETDEGGCQLCCMWYGYDYGWDEELGCACNPW